MGSWIFVLVAALSLLADAPEADKGAEKPSEVAKFGGKSAPEWIDQLDDDDEAVLIEAIDALGNIGPAAKDAADALADLMQHDVDYIRLRAARATWRIARREEAVTALAEVVKNGEEVADQIEAIVMLERIGTAAKPAVPNLVEALKDEDEELRLEAAYCLWRVARHDAAIPTLIPGLKSESLDFREAAAMYLGRIGPAAKAAVPNLIDALKDPHDRVREEAAYALGLMGPAAKSAVPALLALANDPDELTREHAAAAVKSIDPAAGGKTTDKDAAKK